MKIILYLSNKLYVPSIVVLLFIWWIIATIVNNPVLPLPQQAIISFYEVFQTSLLEHTKVSLFRVLVSVIGALLLAVPLGLFLGKNKYYDELCAPLIYLTYPIPKVVFMPIFFILLGIGDTSKIMLICLTVFYQILVATRDAARNIDNQYILAVTSLGIGKLAIYKHVYIPACLPAIFTALRIGLGTALAVLFLTETYATQQGIGYFIMDALARLAYDEMFAAIMAMSLMGLILYLLVDKIEQILCPWPK